MARIPRAFCSDVSEANGEPLSATASRIEHWILVEYSGVWARDELDRSLLPEELKRHLRGQLEALPRSRLLFVRRSERRRADRLAVFWGRSEERRPRFHCLEVADPAELVGIDFAASLATGQAPAGAAPLDHPLLVVCTHGKRDPCCARRGRPLYDGLREQTDAGWVWQSTHVGGDRFAGNLVCFPEGLYFGRVSRPAAATVLDEYVQGRIDLEHYRGRCCYGFAVQAAERAVRLETGLTGIDDLAAEGVRKQGERAWRVRFLARGEPYDVDVLAEEGDPTKLTCAASTPKRPLRYRTSVAGSPRARAS